jgi:hypothetical protein
MSDPLQNTTNRCTRFRCRVCGKLTAGRMPREGRASGDTSERWPRRHAVAGRVCEGVYHLAEWVDVPAEDARENARSDS